MSEWPDHEIAGDKLPDEGGAREFRLGDGDWPFRGIVLRRDGEYACFANVCPHRRHPLNLGQGDFFTPDGQLLRCASHGALFDSETGVCVAGPCVWGELRRLACKQVGDSLFVNAPISLRDCHF
jgi:nitrite reductase/ring-hydroxylating ferredoxin subunit